MSQRASDKSEVDRLRSELDVLMQISALSMEVADVDYLLTRSLEVICKAHGWLAGQYWIVESSRLICSANSHAAFVDISEYRQLSLARSFGRGESLVGISWDTESAVWSDTEDAPVLNTEVSKPTFAFPVRRGRSVVGVCEFITGDSKPVAAHAYFFERLGSYLGQVLVQKETEHKLHLTELKYRQIVSKAYDGFIAMDRSGVIIDWNIQCEKMFGWFKKDVLGKRFFEFLFAEPYGEQYRQAIVSFNQTGNSTRLNSRADVEALRHDGHQFPIEIAIFPVAYSNDFVFGAFVRDVTAKREQESREQAVKAELVRARDEALELSTLKSQFVATMSHEIRTPMAGLLGSAELIALSTTDVDLQELSSHLLASGQRLMRIVDDLLDFSKLEAGKISLVKENFSIKDLVDDVLRINAPLVKQKEIELISSIDAEIPSTLIADAFRIRQILLNLISNAIKFSVSGLIEITVNLFAEGRDESQLVIGVKDQGIGISKEAQHYLFEPFMQAEQSNTRRYGGTGLGLSICKGLAELMGGKISFTSELGIGSTFLLSIPVGVAVEAQAQKLQM